MRFFLYLFLSLAALCSGCSQKLNNVYETLELATVGIADTQLSNEKILQIPYASIYTKIGDGPQAFMVLGFYEHEQAKCFSADSAMIATRHGRIVKTIGLYGQNLEAVTELEQDPLGLNLNFASTPKFWQRRADWSPNYQFNVKLSSSFERVGQESLQVLGQTRIAQKYLERVQWAEGGYDNLFWIDSETGQVLKSQQQLGPNMPIIEIVHLKRYQS